MDTPTTVYLEVSPGPENDMPTLAGVAWWITFIVLTIAIWTIARYLRVLIDNRRARHDICHAHIRHAYDGRQASGTSGPSTTSGNDDGRRIPNDPGRPERR